MSDSGNDFIGLVKKKHRDECLAKLAEGIDVHSKEREGEAIFWACGMGDMELLTALDKAGVRFDNQEAFTMAAYNGYSQMVSFLVDKGVDIHHNGEEALRKAVDKNHFDTAELLLSLGAKSEVAIEHMSKDEMVTDLVFSILHKKDTTIERKIEWLRETATKVDLAMKLKDELSQPGKAEKLVSSINEDAPPPQKQAKSTRQKI